jgi:hypothetical protein
MGALFQALEIIYEVQMKRNNEIIIIFKKKLSNLQDMFFSFSLWTPNPTFKPHNFDISYSFKMI